MIYTAPMFSWPHRRFLRTRGRREKWWTRSGWWGKITTAPASWFPSACFFRILVFLCFSSAAIIVKIIIIIRRSPTRKSRQVEGSCHNVLIVGNRWVWHGFVGGWYLDCGPRFPSRIWDVRPGIRSTCSWRSLSISLSNSLRWGPASFCMSMISWFETLVGALYVEGWDCATSKSELVVSNRHSSILQDWTWLWAGFFSLIAWVACSFPCKFLWLIPSAVVCSVRVRWSRVLFTSTFLWLRNEARWPQTEGLVAELSSTVLPMKGPNLGWRLQPELSVGRHF